MSNAGPNHAALHQVVIAGGGAGGLELAARLGRRFGPDHVILIDKSPEHIWKPSLHEVAAGTLDIHREGLSYFMLARDCGFSFMMGEIDTVLRAERRLRLKPMALAQSDDIIPAREIAYDTLVLAVGSKSNFFGTPGAAEFAIALDSTEQAERFRMRLMRELVLLNERKASQPNARLDIAIVGGGATGVELAAELLEASVGMSFYGLDRVDPRRDVRVALVEGGPRLLPALPQRLSDKAQGLLVERGVQVHTSVRVARVEHDALFDANGKRYAANLCVWAAGIEAPAFLSELGLSVNRIHQVQVDAALRTEDPSIYAIGDCAQAQWDAPGSYLPARAQVAHQQAGYLFRAISARVRGQQPPDAPFQFRDYGSLVSVGHTRGVGSLMGVLAGRSWFVEGLLARLMYMSLHLMHHMAILGPMRTATLALGRLLLKRSHHRVKLH